jgi:hypothetical protein
MVGISGGEVIQRRHIGSQYIIVRGQCQCSHPFIKSYNKYISKKFQCCMKVSKTDLVGRVFAGN